MCKVAKLLNAIPGRSLTWDFNINNTATLGVLKPDGHARLSEDSGHRKNMLQHAIIVELKAAAADSLLVVNDSKGENAKDVWFLMSLSYTPLSHVTSRWTSKANSGVLRAVAEARQDTIVCVRHSDGPS
jgi:hypothetical protein